MTDTEIEKAPDRAPESEPLKQEHGTVQPLVDASVPAADRSEVQAEVHEQLHHNITPAETPGTEVIENAPIQAAEKTSAPAGEIQTAGPAQIPDAELAELVDVIRGGDMLDLLSFMKTHDVGFLCSRYEAKTGESLEALLHQANPEFDDGCIRSFIKGEIIEACAMMLRSGLNSRSMSTELISQLGDVLSDPELQAVVQTYGMMFLSNMNMDILQSLPEIDRFQAAPYLAALFGSEEEVLRYLKDEANRELLETDPASRVLIAASIQLQEVTRSLEKKLQEALQPGPVGAGGLKPWFQEGIRDASEKLEANAVRKRKFASARRMFRIIAAVILGLLLAVAGGANLTFRAAIPCIFGVTAWLFSPVPEVRGRKRKRRK